MGKGKGIKVYIGLLSHQKLFEDTPGFTSGVARVFFITERVHGSVRDRKCLPSRY